MDYAKELYAQLQPLAALLGVLNWALVVMVLILFLQGRNDGSSDD